TESFSNIDNGLAAGERVLSLMDQKSEVNDPEKPQTIGEFKESICLRNVSFSYESTPVLKDVNLEIKKGETVALVGPSGAGKSTLMDLIPRFMDVTSGEVLFDGIDVRQLSQDELRSHIGLVNQESILFNDSIFNNIAFAHPETMLQEVQEAAKIANAHEFIDEMPDGYHTNIGDRGAKLSGGQRQRVCIARAVLKNPPILLLDEATSALDTESEKLVQDSLYRLMQNRTTLVIAHRLSTIQNADKIV